MKVSELRDIAEALSRFATVREKALGPESKIGVQVASGRLKLISGSSVGGMIVDVQPCEGKFSYAIEARPFLQSAKVLPVKEIVEITATPTGIEIKSSGGGKVVLHATGEIREAGFAKKPKSFRASVPIVKEQWGQLSRLFKEVSEKVEVPDIQLVAGDIAYAVAISSGIRARYASLALRGATGDENYSASGYLDFWESLRVLGGDGNISLGHDGILAASGTLECYSGPYLVSRYDSKRMMAEPPREPPPWPVMEFRGEPVASLTYDRKNLLAVIKGQRGYDEHNRITFDVEQDLFTIRPYGSESGQSIPALTQGTGSRSCNADYLSGVVSAMDDTKEITLRWGKGSPAISVTAKEYSGWTILVAPIIKH